MRLKILLLVLLGLVVYMAYVIWPSVFFVSRDKAVEANQVVELSKPDRQEIIKIQANDTFGKLMEAAGIAPALANDLFEVAEGVYDLSNIRVGRDLIFVYDKDTDDFKQLIYPIDTEEELFITKQTSGEWLAERVPIPYEIKIKTSSGSIESSMYESALAAGIDERAIIDLADIFQWSVDFALQVRQGDAFKFIYEERYRDGEYIMPGRILAGKFVNEGTEYYAFYFINGEAEGTYYDQDGNSVQKIFLRAPVAYKYITSGYTTGARYIQAFNISTGHRAIDYAADYGTPVRAVGDGTVVLAGWSGSYGNKVSIRHNSTYTTNYAHLSKFAVKYGDTVKQGDTIGYVGSTGLSTGPHLHYEMVKNGSKINPLTEILPPGDPIKEENKERFFSETNDLKNKLDI